MNRTELVQTLANFFAPLGPFVSAEERETQWLGWLKTLQEETVPSLLDLLINPPQADDYEPASWQEFEFEVTEALTAICLRNPQHWLEVLGPQLTNPSARPGIIEVIGGLGLAEGLSWLKPLIDKTDMTTDEWVRLACSLGMIGGPEARSLLKQMETLPEIPADEVLKEIKIAMDYC
ncbi:MAG: HEAT repeat domain-containing protein [Candidatus Nitronauta litoralis]|uniref:HEAT repeat domain-containing protein n=1 Tax=Candidatus Nitronauta litoralis TaxID=2705533 RepID=A0A7T0BXN2_9BACT|nr:MAG: HEAT repeat domain-containing protein [Candidatus Nitronauta litoralis]